MNGLKTKFECSHMFNISAKWIAELIWVLKQNLVRIISMFCISISVLLALK